jgi:hypothetical protein
MTFLGLSGTIRFDKQAHGIRQARMMAGTIICGLLLTLGCGKNVKLPPTNPTRGKVVFRQGGHLTGGSILFVSQDNPSVSASSKIGEDGTFELRSFIAGDEAPGAIAGSHRVTIIPPCIGNEFSMPSIPEQTVSVSPGENNFTITIDKR